MKSEEINKMNIHSKRILGQNRYAKPKNRDGWHVEAEEDAGMAQEVKVV
jgi:hypothetical protein